MKYDVHYMSGAGNLFSVIDGRKSTVTVEEWSSIAPILCGVDGLNFRTEGLIILLNGGEILDFQTEFFNPDGSHGAMCGNGGRCAVQFAKQVLGLNRVKNFSFTMAGALYFAEFHGNNVRVHFPQPLEIKRDLHLESTEMNITCDYVDVGSQHIVVDYAQISSESESFNTFDINQFAPPFRNHEALAPQGANVNLYSLQSNKSVMLRTFERGVEAETGACGTGALSSAVSLILAEKAVSPVKIIPTSGKPIIVGWNDTNLWLEGPAEFIGRTEIIIP
ncbi:MAG: diaminopimelate epimerase [Ignavibacteria bacterium]|nr:diaminopimelate epimerase [Ignavibacteria bacterium]